MHLLPPPLPPQFPPPLPPPHHTHMPPPVLDTSIALYYYNLQFIFQVPLKLLVQILGQI